MDENQDYDRKWKSNFERELGRLTDSVNLMLIQISVTQERITSLQAISERQASRLAQIESNADRVRGGVIVVLAFGAFVAWILSSLGNIRGIFK